MEMSFTPTKTLKVAKFSSNLFSIYFFPKKKKTSLFLANQTLSQKFLYIFFPEQK